MILTREIAQNAEYSTELGSLVEFLDHLRKPIRASEREVGEIPYYGANGIQGYVRDHIFDEPLILLAEDGGHFDNPSRGIAYEIEGKSWVNNHAHVLRASSKVDHRYLLWALRHYDVTPYITGSTRAKLTKGQAKKLVIPLPKNLQEQRRIAAILDKADVIRRKRDQVIAMADNFLTSTFLEMFGDPISNPHSLPVLQMGEMLQEIRYGTSTKCRVDEIEGDTPVLRIPNVISQSVNWNQLKYTKLPDQELSRLLMKNGDVLFVRSNGNPDYIGRCAVFSGNRKAVFASYLIRARLKSDAPVSPNFITKAISMPSYRHRLLQDAKTTAGNYNINTKSLKALPIICPPYDMQEKYSAIQASVDKVLDSSNSQRGEANVLFASISQRAFRGEL